MVVIILENILKRFKEVVAADIPYLKIEDKEFFGLLGPSGSGKTTTLRIIAGLTKPDRGRILVDGEDITNKPPEKRNMGMVFQSWALFPHLTAYENIAFGLRLRKIPENEIKTRIKWAAELLQIEELLDRYPHQMSGGQQQRVAVARAIVLQPRALLFDEPLSNLDAKLREQVRFELRKLQKRLKITSIYVTHDQAEAFAICDRIAILNRGRIQQIGTPEEIYNKPATKFVAGFLGITRFVRGKIVEVLSKDTGEVLVETEDHYIVKAISNLQKVSKSSNVLLVIRPEYITLARETGDNVFEVVVERATYTGDAIDYDIKLGKWDLRFKTPANVRIAPGTTIKVRIDPSRVVAIPED